MFAETLYKIFTFIYQRLVSLILLTYDAAFLQDTSGLAAIRGIRIRDDVNNT